MVSDLDLVRLRAANSWVLDGRGRILRANSPDEASAPAVFIAGCGEGNLSWFGPGVDGAKAVEIERVVHEAARLIEQGAAESLATICVGILGGGAVEIELSWALDRFDGVLGVTTVVSSGSPGGEVIETRLLNDGMPAAFVEAGFVDVDELWPPWCIAFGDGELASIAFAARVGSKAAEIGLHTMPRFRGRGLAVLATRAWTQHPELAGKTLFYSTSTGNTASRAVVAKLDARFLGFSASIG